jgi:enoyl-[acyl-carrier-protein] reductase (NADH)
LSRFGFGTEGETEQDTNERLASVVPLRRLTQPDDVAAAATFLASDEACGITGVTLNVDSGRHL